MSTVATVTLNTEINSTIDTISTLDQKNDKELTNQEIYQQNTYFYQEWLPMKKMIKKDLSYVLSKFYYIKDLPTQITRTQLEDSLNGATNNNLKLLKYLPIIYEKKNNVVSNNTQKQGILKKNHAFVYMREPQIIDAKTKKKFVINTNSIQKVQQQLQTVDYSWKKNFHYKLEHGVVKMPYKTYNENILTFTMLYEENNRINLDYIINEMLTFMDIPQSLIKHRLDLGVLNSKSGKIEKYILEFEVWQIAALFNLFWDYEYVRIHFLKYGEIEKIPQITQ